MLLDLRFGNGSALHAEHDAGIEMVNQEARLAAAPPEDPVAILTRAERDVLGSAGCGIDWKRTETRPVEEDTAPGARRAAAIDTVYRGETCNCQVWIRRDEAKRVIGLGLRSAC